MEPPCRCPIIVCNNSLFKKMWVWMKSSGLSLVLAVLSTAAPYCAIVQPVIMSSSGATVGKQMGHQVMGEIYLGSYSCCTLFTGACPLQKSQVSARTVNSEYDHQAARAGNNNNPMLRVPKWNLPRLPWYYDRTQIVTTTGRQRSKVTGSCGLINSFKFNL